MARLSAFVLSIPFAAIGLPGCAALTPWNEFTTEAGDSRPPIEFVQVNWTAVSDEPVSIVKVAITKAQRKGDLLVVGVGWFDPAASVVSVVDEVGSNFQRAVGPTTAAGAEPVLQSLYYAAGVLGAEPNRNQVTVTFSVPVDAPDVRVLEYAGCDEQNPLDITSSRTGKSTATTSGPVTTKFARAVLVGVGMTQSDFSNGGAGFALRVITPNTNLAQDRIVNSLGTYSSEAPQDDASEWVMQIAAFH